VTESDNADLDLVAFVKPLVPLIDPVENSIKRCQNETVLQSNGRTLEQCVNESYHLSHADNVCQQSVSTSVRRSKSKRSLGAATSLFRHLGRRDLPDEYLYCKTHH